MGVKNQKGKTIINIKKKQIKPAERFFERTIFKINLCKGVKINANIIPTIKDNKIGFNKRKDRARRIIKIIVVMIFLKYSSLIFR